MPLIFLCPDPADNEKLSNIIKQMRIESDTDHVESVYYNSNLFSNAKSAVIRIVIKRKYPDDR